MSKWVSEYSLTLGVVSKSRREKVSDVAFGISEKSQGMTGGGTNKRITEFIKKCLSQGKVVTIWAWKPESEIEVKNLKVDLVKGLENPLIQQFRPEWNIKG